MIGPEYDRGTWNLYSQTGPWALLILKKDAGMACVIKYEDGDWELNDSGSTEDMTRKYNRVREPDLKSGVGMAAFEKAFPSTDWEQVDFIEVAGINYTLWRRLGAHAVEAPGLSISSWEDERGLIQWNVMEDDIFSTVRVSFETFKKANPAPVVLPVADPDPALAHPNFGRF